MKYVLSDCRITDNSLEYIKDLIKINMILLPKEVPYFKGGSDELLKGIELENLESNIKKSVDQVIDRAVSLMPRYQISIESVEINNTNVLIKININNLIETYEIKRFNKTGAN